MISRLIKKVMPVIDPELRLIARIIRDGQRHPTGISEMDECNALFINRLRENPFALKMSYWQNHFELKSINNFPEIGGKILDFGCGSGHLDVYIARGAMVVHGIDMSPIAIRIANYIRNKENAEVRSRLSFELADVTKPRKGDDLYDSVWSTDVFEHIENPNAILIALRDWTVKRAPILISVPLGYAYDDPTHVHHWQNSYNIKIHFQGLIDIIKIEVDKEYQRIRLLGRL